MPNGKYRVLHIFSGYGGGISSLILNLIENSDNDFVHDTLAFSYSGGEQFQQRLRAKGTVCYEMPRPRVKGLRAFVCFLKQLFTLNQYDAVHCHVSGWLVTPFYYAARNAKVGTFVIHAHTTRYDKWIDRTPLVGVLDRFLNYKYATQYMACSDWAAEYIFGKRYLEHRAAMLIPNGINEESYDELLTQQERDAYDYEFSVQPGQIKVLHAGRFSFPKNHEYLIELAAKMKAQNASFVFLLAGDGERFGEIESLIQEHCLTDVIKLLGRRNDLAKLMQYGDCMVLPSHNEGLPTVAVECQAAGKPIIIADTVTPQCDMNLGLVHFLPLRDVDQWVKTIVDNAGKCLPVHDCVAAIRSQGFTAREAGHRYCEKMRSCIEKAYTYEPQVKEE